MSGDRGSVTAEFAVALPAVLLLMALLLSVVRLGATQVGAVDAAADAARSLGRDDGSEQVESRLARQLPGAAWSASRSGGLVCVDIIVPATGPAGLLGVAAHGHACALDGGR